MDEMRSNEDIKTREEYLAPFKLNIGGSIDKMLGVFTGEYRAPSIPGERDNITKPIKENSGGSFSRMSSFSERETEHAGEPSENRIERHSSRKEPAVYKDIVNYSKTPSKYAQIIKECERFPFSEDEEKFNKQMEYVIAGIRSSLQDLIIRDVANNTRKAFGEFVKDVFKIGGGIKVNYDFNGVKVSVSARGAFIGDETICVARKDDKVVVSVIRNDENTQSDLTSNFGITVGD